MKTPKFEIYRAPDGWRWRLKSRNGEIVASGEAYTSKRGAERGAAACRRNAAAAVLMFVH